MKSNLADRRLFARFATVSVVGMAADYLLAVFLASNFATPYVVASTVGFILGTIVNYCGHTIFSYEHTDKSSLSVPGYGKYLLAVAASLLVRLAVVVGLQFATQWAFWFILICAIGASFIASYVISTLWVFKKPG